MNSKHVSGTIWGIAVPNIQTCHRPLPRVLAYIRPHRVSQNGRTELTLKREKTSFYGTYKEPLCRLRQRSASGQTTRSMSAEFTWIQTHEEYIQEPLLHSQNLHSTCTASGHFIELRRETNVNILFSANLSNSY